MKKILIAASLGLAFTAQQQASASTFDFSYAYNDGVGDTGTIAGVINGTLQPDNNTVIVNSIQNLTLNGTPESALLFSSSSDVYYVYSTGLLPTTTLNGSFMDMFACDIPGVCTSFLEFDFGNNLATSTSPNFTISLPGTLYSGTFVQADWSMNAVTSVPVPAALPLLAVGGLAFGWQRRRKAA